MSPGELVVVVAEATTDLPYDYEAKFYCPPWFVLIRDALSR